MKNSLARRTAEHGAQGGGCLLSGLVESSSIRMRCPGPSRSSNWPERVAHQNSPPITKASRIENGISKYRLSTATPCAQVCGERRLYTVAAHASRSACRHRLDPYGRHHIPQQQGHALQGQPSGHRHHIGKHIYSCSEQHGDGATPPDRIQCPLAHDTHCCTLLPLAVRHRAMLRHCRQNPMELDMPLRSLIQPSHPGIRP